MSLERFRKVYAVLPERERELPIVVIGNEEISWERAFDEIRKETRLGEKIQKKLEELDII